MRTILALFFACWTLSAAPLHTATVIETMNAGGYTYMQVRESGDPYWVAVTATAVKPGERVSFTEEMWMPNFKSRALGRTFDTILFASMAGGARPDGAEPVQNLNAPQHVIGRDGGSLHVAEVYATRYALNGKAVRVHGKVTKISRGIMKRDWVHLQDGTGDDATNDLVLTTENAGSLKEGETVSAVGTATVDKDFGYGYFYPILLENSRFESGR